MRVLFLLPGRGGGGGAHSVVQEAIGLKRFGVKPGIATTDHTAQAFRSTYPELEQHDVPVIEFQDAGDLAADLTQCEIAVATTFDSAHTLSDALRKCKGSRPRTAYYVQDYEPLFCLPGTVEWERARTSYSLVADQLLFAKTEWLCGLVAANHQRAVKKVLPSIDHQIYCFGPRPDNGVLTVTAMIRPRTPRRAPRRTARILERIAGTFGDKVNLVSFGAPLDELSRSGIRLSERITHGGQLSRHQVAEILRRSDIFLDLSDYQAFGRTGLEGMACGCVPVLPSLGGTTEYARNFVNSVVVDTRSDEAIMNAVSDLVSLDAVGRRQMVLAAVETALNYTIEKAAFSEFAAFSSFLATGA